MVNPKVGYRGIKIVKNWDLSQFWPVRGPNWFCILTIDFILNFKNVLRKSNHCLNTVDQRSLSNICYIGQDLDLNCITDFLNIMHKNDPGIGQSILLL